MTLRIAAEHLFEQKYNPQLLFKYQILRSLMINCLSLNITSVGKCKIFIL